MPKDEPLIRENFLLENDTAMMLYYEYAQAMPIVDYHNHLPPRDIAENRSFRNLTQLWLEDDHYKWRLMRANGVPESHITGDADDREKFQCWAETVPAAVRNPMYHWTHMEMNRPFGLHHLLLSPDTAEEIWTRCGEKLAAPEFSARGLLRQFNVEWLCTTDDPLDDLRYHQQMAQDADFDVGVYPALRPDASAAIEDPKAFNAWVDRLAGIDGSDVQTMDEYLSALDRRHAFFHTHGCRLADHGLTQAVDEDFDASEIERIYGEVRAGHVPHPLDAAKFKTALLLEWGRMHHRRGWVQQYHLGALRNVNTRFRESLGANCGCDTIGPPIDVRALAGMLDRLDREEHLPKTILYNLNPADNEMVAALAGCFQGDGAPGKVQYGSAWWFLDHKSGMEDQMEALSNAGLLRRFIGMLTDSRSLLSFSRHEYFRRILCNLLGREMEAGLIPRDVRHIGEMVQAICVHNAVEYFGRNPTGEVK